MTNSKVTSLVEKIDAALEECYVAQANNDVSCPEDIYYLAEEALDSGIGGVLVHTSHGHLKWFDLTNLEF